MARNNRLERDTEEGFLHRWSRRKSGRDEELESSATEVPSPEDASGDDPDRHDQPAKTDADMPPLDTIGPGSDISDFFSSGVSETLRNQALRRLFRLPAYNVTDGLDDYAENYNTFEVLGDVMTADRRYREEFEKARAAEKQSVDESESSETADHQAPDAPASGEEDGEDIEADRRDVAAHRADENEEHETNPNPGPGNRGTEA